MNRRTGSAVPTGRLRLASLLALLACGLIPATAQADTVTSQNWSGYAVHHNGVKFRTATASWHQPTASCVAGQTTYSAFWVGLGGYSLSSTALEQVGTELDCQSDGTQIISAWYELVPAPSRAIRMAISPGDLMSARVAVRGRRVTVALADRTRHTSFTRTITDHSIDVSSAEWIAEAPSDCSGTSCQTLSLANFGQVRFDEASAQTTSGRWGAVTSSRWQRTKILLGYKAQGAKFVAQTSTANAAPGALQKAGHTFTVKCSAPSTSSSSTTGSTGTGTGTGSGSTGSGTGAVGGGPGGAGPGGLTGNPAPGGPGGYGGNPGGDPGGSGNAGGAFGGGVPFGTTRR